MRIVKLIAIGIATFLVVTPAFLNGYEGGSENSAAKTSSRSAKSVSREKIMAVSSKIDSLVEAQLKAKGEQLNPVSSDAVFLRRAYLDIAGRIPTIDETKDFLKSSSATKREKLIDELLDSYGYVSRQYNFWADILRIKTRQPGGLSGVGYIDYVKDSLESNKPYDVFVRDLLSSNGSNLERGNGAVNYYLRDRNMPEDNMSNTVRVFLGTRLECAQCHDHPFDKWTQRQYFEMVAFTGGMRFRADGNADVAKQIRAAYRGGDVPEKIRPRLNRLQQMLTHGVSGSGTGLAKLPEGYLGDEGYEGEVIVGKTMFEGKKLVDAKIPAARKSNGRKPKKNIQQGFIPGAKEMNSREIYANWLTDPQNPRFAKVIANRLWKQALGLGLIEPVDILEDNTVASNPELMEFLTETMIDMEFDMKQFLRAIYNSKVYQAAAYNKDVMDATKYNFNGPVVRRMSAEQIWDSLMVLTVPDTDERYSPETRSQYGLKGNDPYEQYDYLKNMTPNQLKDFIATLGDMNQNKKKTNYKDDPAYQKLKNKQKQLAAKIKQANKQRNVKLVRELKIEQAKLVSEFRKNGRGRTAYLRASEMESPARAGHFLREFGQSDREQIENSNSDPAVTQVLSMMNGYIEEKISRDGSSVLMQTALSAKSAKECTELIFLSMLNRKPTGKEASEWRRDFDSAQKAKPAERTERVKEVYTDLIWTLANSNEFIFVK